jgi:hypothetical protein
MRVLMLIVAAALSACGAMTAGVPAGADAGAQTMLMANRQTRSTTGSRTQTVGLPLSRAGKIGLWAGVAVFLAYLMATDGEDEPVDPVEP